MSLIKNLKENPDNSVNIVEILEELYPEIKTKYHEMFIRVLKNEIQQSNVNSKNIEFKVLFKLLLSTYIRQKTKDENIFERFIYYNEKNQIEKNDLSCYKNINEIISQVKIADDVEEIKKIESQIVKLFEDDDWVIIKPLTHKSSVKYGYGTKWCTAMENNSSYFSDYTKKGILIYCINKKQKNGSIAVYKEINSDLSFWTSVDVKIDSIEANLPNDVVTVIRKEIKGNIPNSNIKFKEDKKQIHIPQTVDIFNGVNGNETYIRALEILQRYNRV